MTKLHAGGKFGGEGYKVSGGLHGVGISVVNALSERLTVEVCRDGYRYRQRYERGVPDRRRVEKVEKCGDRLGTTIHFMPDSQIFDDLNFNFSTLSQRLREMAFLNRSLRISAHRRARRGRARSRPRASTTIDGNGDAAGRGRRRGRRREASRRGAEGGGEARTPRSPPGRCRTTPRAR